MEPDTAEREAYEKQAKEMLEGKQVWRPTWQALGFNYDRPAIPPSPKGPASGIGIGSGNESSKPSTTGS